MSGHLPVHVQVADVSYSVTKSTCGRNRTTTDILQDVNISAAPGELVAIIGPSGSGKTTLLNCVAARVSSGTLTGSIRFNGLSLKDKIKYISNYVMQKEDLMPFLTVKETLSISADLRMKTATRAERKTKVDFLLRELSLTGCQNTLVGGERKKGISGGQTKRLAIGMELLEDPPILFLDEPTTGLDSSLAYDLLLSLLKIAKGGKTVMCTVHQPRSQVFHVFDKLVVLWNGYVVFQGHAKEASLHFSKLGYQCPVLFNPADFILDLLTIKPQKEGQPAAHSQTRFHISAEEIEEFPQKYATSEHAAAVSQLLDTTEATPEQEAETLAEIQQYIANKSGGICGWFRATMVLVKRGFINIIRNPVQGIAAIAIQLIIGLVVGGIFFQIDRGQDTLEGTRQDAWNLTGVVVSVVLQLAFGGFDALVTFQEERALFNRETANGLYNSLAYYIAHQISYYPFTIARGLALFIPFYFMTRLGFTGEHFGISIVVVLATVFTAFAFAMLVSAASPNSSAANILAPLFMIMFMLVAGFFLSDDAIPDWIAWLKYISFVRYSYYGLVHAVMRPGEVWGSGDGEATVEDLLDMLDLSSNVWDSVAILLGLGGIFHVFAALCLTFLHRKKGLES